MDNNNNKNHNNLPKDDSASKRKLNIKLKFPNSSASPASVSSAASEVDQGVGESSGPGADVGGGGDSPLKPGQLGYRVCEVCGKEFSTGKAWGGHKRHHQKTPNNDTPKNDTSSTIKQRKHDGGEEEEEEDGSKIVGKCSVIKAGDVKMGNDGRKICRICGETFGSLNSLFGHLRSHSARAQNSGKMTQINSAPVFTAEKSSSKNKNIDLLRSLSSNWSKTNARVRGSHCSPEVTQAAHTLMSLSRDKNWRGATGFARKSLEKAFVGSNTKRLGFDFDHSNNEISGSSSSPLKNIRKKKLEIKEDNDNADVTIDKIPEPEAEEEEEEQKIRVSRETNFQCDICNKNFKSGQALGGHKRSHWKAQIANNNNSSSSPPPASNNGGMLGIDLNKPYVQENNEDGDEDEAESSSS